MHFSIGVERQGASEMLHCFSGQNKEVHIQNGLVTAVLVVMHSCPRKVRANIYRKSGKLLSVSLLNIPYVK